MKAPADAYTELERANRAALNIMEDLDRRRRELEERERQLKSTQAQLLQASKMTVLGEMSTAFVHELSQPLLGIHGFVVAMREEIDRLMHEASAFGTAGPASLQRVGSDLAVITQQVERITTLIDNVRYFARGSTIEMLPMDVNGPVRAAVALFREQLRRRQVEVEEIFGTDLPPVIGNANLLEQACINLLTNARDAIVAKGIPGRLQIRTTAVADGTAPVCIEFIDDGIGADPETIQRMCEPFFTTKPPGHGLGLGLAIVTRIVEDHRGVLRIHGEPQAGCTLTLCLPRAQAGLRDSEPALASAEPGSAARTGLPAEALAKGGGTKG